MVSGLSTFEDISQDFAWPIHSVFPHILVWVQNQQIPPASQVPVCRWSTRIAGNAARSVRRLPLDWDAMLVRCPVQEGHVPRLQWTAHLRLNMPRPSNPFVGSISCSLKKREKKAAFVEWLFFGERTPPHRIHMFFVVVWGYPHFETRFVGYSSVPGAGLYQPRHQQLTCLSAVAMAISLSDPSELHVLFQVLDL